MSYRKNRLVLTVSLLLVVGFLITSLASFFVSRASIRSQIQSNELPITSDNVYSEIQRDLLGAVFISSLMATNTFLRDWVIEGEQDESQITRYLKEIQTKYNTSTSFFVSEQTGVYYQAAGILKKVSPVEEQDKWYFRVREMKADYEINVDPDMANKDEMSVFVNYKVYNYNGDYIGATGVGLQIDIVKKFIAHYQKRYNSNIYFIDKRGNITLHGVNFPLDVKNIHAVAGLSSFTKDILSSDFTSIQYKNNGRNVYLHTRYIPEFGWYLLVEQNEKESTRKILNALFMNLAICFFVTFVVLFLTKKTVTAYQGQIESLRGIVPICSYCKKIRDDKGFWKQVEAYISEHTDAEFSHGVCPDCFKIEMEKLGKDA